MRGRSIYYFLFIQYVSIHLHVHTCTTKTTCHGMSMKVRTQFAEVSTVLPPCGFQGSKSDAQA